MNALSDPSKEYSKDEGVMSMLWRAWKDGPAKNLGHVGKTGPITKNGGEVCHLLYAALLWATALHDGSC